MVLEEREHYEGGGPFLVPSDSAPPYVAAMGLCLHCACRLQSLHAVVSQLALLPIAAQAYYADSGSSNGGEAPPCPGLVGGGGILAHAVARLAAWLKVRNFPRSEGIKGGGGGGR